MKWEQIKRIDSSEGNVCKFVYTKSDAVAESVLYRYPTYEERTVICCSTQSGCPVGCRFCGAGDAFVRNLKGDEIISQVQHSINETGVEPGNIERLQIMFMSMGEPFLNQSALCGAIRSLHDLYPSAALLVSTIGPRVDYEDFISLSCEIDTIGLQFSIHESTNRARNKLIPYKGKLTLEDIAQVGLNWNRYTDRRPFFNYCASDHNTTSDDVYRLQHLFDPRIWECTISVICERNEGLPARNQHQVDLARNFSDTMVEAGYSVRVFDPAGQDDIGGGCGQLWFVQRWIEENRSLARPSVGYGLPVIHCPTDAGETGQ